MGKLNIDFDEMQKAMEDLSREAFDYYLDIETGEIIVISEDIIQMAIKITNGIYEEDMKDYEEVEFDEECEIPEWIEDEIELALDIYINKKDCYIRIPERNSSNAYNTMKEFTERLENMPLKESLQNIIDGKGSFRRYKEALAPYPKERKLWYGFNAKAAREYIEQWLKNIEIEFQS
jgi:hypothetical protein